VRDKSYISDDVRDKSYISDDARSWVEQMLKIVLPVCEIWADKSKLGDFWTPPISLKIGEIAEMKKGSGDIS
jgi:hypothetical protein